ncbi:cytochrome C [bacterium]|nr:MAG: cytochrome C [bacterium]
MKSLFKWLGIILGSIVVIILLFAGFIYWKSGSILNRQYEVQFHKVTVQPDSLTLARGQHLVGPLTGCVDCHGVDLSGTMLMDAMPFAVLAAPNLTSGMGGLPEDYSFEQFDLAIRHGVKRDGKGIWIMPSYHYVYLSDEDAFALYTYLKSVKPVNKQQPEFQLGPIGRMVLVMGGFPGATADMILHDKKPPAKPVEAPTREYGEYIARIGCIGCHGPNLSGGLIYGADPSWPPAANITMGGKLRMYKSVENLAKLLREGERPDGSVVHEAMPVKTLGDLTDDEITALWLYLSQHPARPDSSATWWNTMVP